jgi:hypothetical protein
VEVVAIRVLLADLAVLVLDHVLSPTIGTARTFGVERLKWSSVSVEEGHCELRRNPSVGPDGLLAAATENVVQAALEAAMAQHPCFEEGDRGTSQAEHWSRSRTPCLAKVLTLLIEWRPRAGAGVG